MELWYIFLKIFRAKNTRKILGNKFSFLLKPNQIEQTKCPQSKPLMPPIQQQHSWQPMNPPNLQISQQPQPILAAQRNNSSENTNLLPTMLNESSSTNSERAEYFFEFLKKF